jgi:predicted transport protein
MEDGLLEKTGKPLAEWIKIVKDSGIEKHKEIINFLKSEHGFSYGYANFVALKARKADAASHDDQDLLTNQYKGKEQLLPIYEKLLTFIKNLGDDIEVKPKKSTVSLVRNKQFALIKPATKTRIDLGLKIKEKPTTERLEDSGPFGSMCTHRVRVSKPDEVDQELLGWIKEAYEAAG